MDVSDKIFKFKEGVIYTDNQEEGAIANGTAIIKQNTEKGDRYEDGTAGVVIGSLKNPNFDAEGERSMFLYFIEWTGESKYIAVVDWKIKEKK